MAPPATWLTTKTINIEENSKDFYADIYHKHNDNNKWIIIINPKHNAVEQLSNVPAINPSNILTVHTNNTKVNIDNIAKALLKGNCAAIVLCDTQLSSIELTRLETCASVGKTKCIMLEHTETFH